MNSSDSDVNDTPAPSFSECCERDELAGPAR